MHRTPSNNTPAAAPAAAMHRTPSNNTPSAACCSCCSRCCCSAARNRPPSNNDPAAAPADQDSTTFPPVPPAGAPPAERDKNLNILTNLCTLNPDFLYDLIDSHSIVRTAKGEKNGEKSKRGPSPPDLSALEGLVKSGCRENVRDVFEKHFGCEQESKVLDVGESKVSDAFRELGFDFKNSKSFPELRRILQNKETQDKHSPPTQSSAPGCSVSLDSAPLSKNFSDVASSDQTAVVPNGEQGDGVDASPPGAASLGGGATGEAPSQSQSATERMVSPDPSVLNRAMSKKSANLTEEQYNLSFQVFYAVVSLLSIHIFFHKDVEATMHEQLCRQRVLSLNPSICAFFVDKLSNNSKKKGSPQVPTLTDSGAAHGGYCSGSWCFTGCCSRKSATAASSEVVQGDYKVSMDDLKSDSDGSDAAQNLGVSVTDKHSKKKGSPQVPTLADSGAARGGYCSGSWCFTGCCSRKSATAASSEVVPGDCRVSIKDLTSDSDGSYAAQNLGVSVNVYNYGRETFSKNPFSTGAEGEVKKEEWREFFTRALLREAEKEINTSNSIDEIALRNKCYVEIEEEKDKKYTVGFIEDANDPSANVVNIVPIDARTKKAGKKNEVLRSLVRLLPRWVIADGYCPKTLLQLGFTFGLDSKPLVELLRVAYGEKDDCDNIRLEYEGAQGDQGQFVNLPCIRLTKKCKELYDKWEGESGRRRDQKRYQIATQIAGDWIKSKEEKGSASNSRPATTDTVPKVRFESASVVVFICRARDTLLSFSQPFSAYHDEDEESDKDEEKSDEEENEIENDDSKAPPVRSMKREASEKVTRMKRRVFDGKKERTQEEKALHFVKKQAEQLNDQADKSAAHAQEKKKSGKKQQAFSDVIKSLKKKTHFSRKGDVRWLLCSIVKDTVDQYVEISKNYDWMLKELRNELYFEDNRRMNFIRSLVALKRLSRRFLRDLHDIKVEIDWILRKIKPVTLIIKSINDQEARDGAKEDARRSKELTMRYNDMQSKVNDFESELNALKDVIKNTKDELEHMVDSSLNNMLSLFTIVTISILPIQLLTGVFGMNFQGPEGDAMPELNWKYGYLWFWFWALGLTGLIMFQFRSFMKLFFA